MLKLTLGFVPVIGVDPKIYYLADKYWKNVNFADPNRPVHSSEKSYELYINTKNNTADFMEVTTENLKILLDGKEIRPYDKNFPSRIILLKPGEELICHIKAVLCIGNVNARWMLSNNSWMTKEIKGLDLTKETIENCIKIRESRHEDDTIDKTFTLSFRSIGQTDEYNIAIRSCKYLLKKLDIINKEIKNMFELKQYQFDGKEYQIELIGENHTIGHLINYELKDNSNIINCGFKHDIMLKTITFKIFADTNKKVVKGIDEAINRCCEKISHLGATLMKLREKRFKNDDSDAISESDDDTSDEESSDSSSEEEVKKIIKKPTKK